MLAKIFKIKFFLNKSIVGVIDFLNKRISMPTFFNFCFITFDSISGLPERLQRRFFNSSYEPNILTQKPASLSIS